MAPQVPSTTESKKPVKLEPAQPIQAPFDEPIPPEFSTEQRAPADPLEHFRKRECSKGHSNWDENRIVFSIDNKRWILKCLDCAKHGIPSWYTITGSALAVTDNRVDGATVTK